MIKMIPNNNLDPNYNYLSDAIDSTGIYQYKSEDYHFCDINFCDKYISCKIKTSINGKCYEDPDCESVKLYQHLSLLTGLEFIDGKEKNYDGERKYKHLLYNNNPYTADYFGISKYWAQYKPTKQVTEPLEIGEMLKIFRTIGGHMIWPSTMKKVGEYYDVETMTIKDVNSTINWARGGSAGVYDRVDLTLYAVKCLYLNIDFKYSDTLFTTMKNESNWFEEYGKGEDGFKRFIDSFLLNDFVDNNYNVLSLVYDRPLEESEKKTSIFESLDSFNLYIENSKVKTKNRSKRLCGIDN